MGRLAPSPTGAQHLGNARTFLVCWLSARRQGGKLILRIEDLDSPRVKSWAVDQISEDLRYLGLDWDEGPNRPGPHSPYRQTERQSLYVDSLDQLVAAGQVYRCVCSRSDIAEAASAPHLGQEGPIYPGTCRERNWTAAEAEAGGAFAWRWRTPDRRLAFVDQLAGPCGCETLSELGDFVVAKWSRASGVQLAYQLAVVLDDHAMGIDEVIRGSDLIPSTFRQRLLFDFFGWPTPTYGHVPLVIGNDGRRLAKRHGDTRLSTLRAAGVAGEAVVGFLAWTLGLRPTAAPVTAKELVADFDPSRIPRQSFVLTDELWQDLLSSRTTNEHRPP